MEGATGDGNWSRKPERSLESYGMTVSWKPSCLSAIWPGTDYERYSQNDLKSVQYWTVFENWMATYFHPCPRLVKVRGLSQFP